MLDIGINLNSYRIIMCLKLIFKTITLINLKRGIRMGNLGGKGRGDFLVNKVATLPQSEIKPK